MSKSEINQRLRKQSIEWYLTKAPVQLSHFSAPEYYSPLYRTLYEHLGRSASPPHLPLQYDDQLRREIEACTSVFDRYLVALYPSRYEASNPHALPEAWCKKELLVEYLSAHYGKADPDGDSYNYDREVKNVFSLINQGEVEHFKKNAKSALYKLLVLSFKLSSINHNWRNMVRLLDDESAAKASMDNIVDFNSMEDEKAQECSALIKMFYYEIDQGKENGDETHSRRIPILTYAQGLLYKFINLHFHIHFIKGTTCQDLPVLIQEMADCFTVKHRPIYYRDANLELFDAVQTSLLKNIFSNGLLARESFDQHTEYPFIGIENHNDWILAAHSDSQLRGILEKQIGKAIPQEWITLSQTLHKILRCSDKVLPETEAVRANLCALIVTQLLSQDTIMLKSRVQGSKRNTYNVMHELKRTHIQMMQCDPELKDKHTLSMMKPTSLHFFEYLYDQAVWSLDCLKLNRANDRESFQQFRAGAYQVMRTIAKQLQPENHVTCLHSLNLFFEHIFNMPFDLDHAFHKSLNNRWFIEQHIERAKIVWSPLG
ncbi:hypothetical protein CIG19_08920 [Enterobacterales bacterium CwR94]|nr:hypothetical protein CIG19_08920 [Enterobacterales bacterium CwR94]